MPYIFLKFTSFPLIALFVKRYLIARHYLAIMFKVVNVTERGVREVKLQSDKKYDTTVAANL